MIMINKLTFFPLFKDFILLSDDVFLMSDRTKPDRVTCTWFMLLWLGDITAGGTFPAKWSLS